MDYTQLRDGTPRDTDGDDAIHGFAVRVLDVLVARSRRSQAVIRRELVGALAEGVVTLDEARILAALAQFRRACIAPAAMVDLYVPAAARLLGADWAGDRMNFADVTIGSARLQALVRAIGNRWGGEAAQPPQRPSVLMIVPEAEDHTLGAIVATGQMRRLGVSVCLRLGPSAGQVAELMRTRGFDAVMVSVGHAERLAAAARVVATVRTHAPAAMPVIAGGAMFAIGVDVAAVIGADFATDDPSDALALCGLAGGTVAAGFAGEAAVSLRG